MRRTVIVACVLAAALMAAGAASAANYVVMYKASATPADSTRSIQKAGGKVVANYDAIGVVVHRRSTTRFRLRCRR
ncbi:MAG: hypothetical protein H0W97_09280, partial [Actinobacteria bacterium]|nr:hypothetical protein [Actinomycetota bacterium]